MHGNGEDEKKEIEVATPPSSLRAASTKTKSESSLPAGRWKTPTKTAQQQGNRNTTSLGNKNRLSLNSSSSGEKDYDDESLSDTSSNSSSGDAFAVFQKYLRGEVSIEQTQRRIVMTPEERKQTRRKQRIIMQRRRQQQQKLSGSTSTTVLIKALRIVILDLPLALLFGSFLLIYIIRNIYSDYYVPLISRARRTDPQLQQEFTYYERQCNEYDLSTRNISDLLLLPTPTSDNTYSSSSNVVLGAAVDTMMRHGGIVIPEILKPDTVQSLRKFVVYKNQAVSEAEKYPVSQGYNRISYGIDASEDPIVASAIQQVVSHPILRPLLSKLLGDKDPASAEITAITSFAGAPDQAWHQDTKQDGNALKFARTYSHSYSLFLPLQDTTERMGATDICPGTHYCANDLEQMCEDNRMGLHLVDERHGVFPAGAGALLNQHVWHRGGAHTDPEAPERVVFILSFLARPNFDRDPRQLSRGTYFHQKWIMWGHTMTDLTDPLKRMKYPFSLLRCLSLWKPASSNWGYDLITSGFMRFANEQLEDEDFEERFLPRLDQWRFPMFLRGRHLRDAVQIVTWTVFIRETIDKVYDYLKLVNIVAHAMYVGVLVLAATIFALLNLRRQKQVRYSDATTSSSFLLLTFSRLFKTHGVLLVLGYLLWTRIQSSQWGLSVSSGRALMRPFPTDSEADGSSYYQLVAAQMVSKGPTTFPTRNDVLLGTRYDAEFLGSYDKWLDYHPGNMVFQDTTSQFASTFAFARQVSRGLGLHVITHVVDAVKDLDGHFLQQDYRTGDWRVLSESEMQQAVTIGLVVSNNGALAAVKKSADWMIARCRFGPGRGRPMALLSHLFLWNLTKTFLLGTDWLTIETPPHTPTAPELIKSIGFRLPQPPLSAVRKKPMTSSGKYSSPLLPKKEYAADTFQPGTLIWCDYPESDEWFPGTVMEIGEDSDWFYIGFDDSTRERGIHRSRLRKYIPVKEGDLVAGCFADGLDECYPGIVEHVFPDGFVSIAYDDGDYDERVPPSNYFQPPYRYEGPFFC